MDLNVNSSIDIIGFRKSLKKEWHNHYEFLTWEHVKHHLKKLGMDQLHCCKFALGGNCYNGHKENSCIKCLTFLSFFKRKVFPLLKNSMKKYLQIRIMKLQP